jgi:MFS family permease
MDVVEFLVSNARFYGCMFTSVFISGVVIYGSQNFRVAFFQRTYHWLPQQSGLIIGVVSLVVSPIGLWAGTWLCELWNRKHDDGNMRVALFANAVSIPFLIAGPLMPDPWLSVACSAVAAALALMAAPPLVAAMQSITPANVRAQVNSLYLLLFSGITGMVGPWFIGLLTDMQHDQTKLRYVLAVTTAIGLPIATLLMAGALKPFGRMIVQLKAAEAAGHS